ncbi:TPA: hypothetical protein ACYSCR_000381 [Klebsiella oxytoca]
MMNTDNIEYIKSGSMWFIKCNHEFIGGRYDSQQTATYAAENLDLPDMDEVWMIKCSLNPDLSGDDLLLHQSDVSAFILQKNSHKSYQENAQN